MTALAGPTEDIADSSVVTAAHCELMPVDKVHHEVSARLSANFLDIVQIYDG